MIIKVYFYLLCRCSRKCFNLITKKLIVCRMKETIYWVDESPRIVKKRFQDMPKMKKIIGAFVFAIIIIIICFQIDVFGQKKIVGQTVSSTNSTVTKTKESFDDTEQETLIKIGKNDRTLYTDDSLTTPLATINGGELAEFLSETKNAYQIKTNDGYTGYLALEDGTKVTKNIQTKPEELSDAVIVLDPGHGGNDTGALSNDEQTEEKDITLSKP